MGKDTFFENSDPKFDKDLHIVHAEDIQRLYSTQAMWYIKEQWHTKKASHQEMIKRRSIKYFRTARPQELIQTWHELVALTAILKTNFEWDNVLNEPRRVAGSL